MLGMPNYSIRKNPGKSVILVGTLGPDCWEWGCEPQMLQVSLTQSHVAAETRALPGLWPTLTARDRSLLLNKL
ncbi:hypothetical protein I79_002556 [Cricetulus griseus]|uniref:Uncharacterized protein n=1 Tax=Cricetulus griseus TaxID=10029 RepID=G3GXR4_CRIGR|nr:hypothetical protein I79_002556 [Cricetulus griseus]